MKKNRIVSLGIALVLILSLVLGGCAPQTPAKSGEPAADKKAAEQPAADQKAAEKSGEPAKKGIKDIKIGYSFQGLSDEYIVFLKESVDAKAKEMGVNILVADGQMSAEKQVSQVENFIAQKVNCIVMNPISMDGCAPAVDAAVAAGIPIITLISITSNQDKATCYVGSDAVESGEIEMKMAAEAMGGKGNIVVMHGQMGHDAQIGRYKGLQNVLKNYPDIKIVAEQTGNWSREEGLKIMENWLSSGKQIDAVVSQNDAMALGALKAIEAKNLVGKIKVFGIDAIPEALDALEKGTMHGTVFQDAKGQGMKSVEIAVKVALGEKVEKNIYIPYLPVLKEDVPKYRK